MGEDVMVGQAKQWRLTIEKIPYQEISDAYENWCRYHSVDREYQIPDFEAFIGGAVEWFGPWTRCQPRVAKRIHMLSNPHYHALLKAHYARRCKR